MEIRLDRVIINIDDVNATAVKPLCELVAGQLNGILAMYEKCPEGGELLHAIAFMKNKESVVEGLKVMGSTKAE